MFILNPPYISNLLKETIKSNNYSLVRNKTSQQLGINANFISNGVELQKELNKSDFKLYINSEDSIEWIVQNLQDTNIPEKIALFKNKVKFRELLKSVYPDFYFKEVSIDELKTMNAAEIMYPIILKPAVGFLSFGVYPIKNQKEFEKIVSSIDEDIQNFNNIFPLEVVDISKFIIEEMITGEEFAIDAYFNSIGEAVILNIFHHPFFDENDVTDRIYYTSATIIKKYAKKFEKLLEEIGSAADLKNFPIHLELRVNGDKIVPIEVNPMRFAGWCDTDLAYYAYGINIYEYYMEDKKPDWDKILKDKGDEMYYFTGAEIPMNINKKKIKSVDYDNYLSFIKKPLEIRKIDYRVNPLFAIVFGRADSYEEIEILLNMDLSKFIKI